ncbi:S1 family peptidase [Pilimelia columellifera]|uniref:Alpha-lytic protease prodomain-containing protein n=1 Tax=Pilimelia columellifera subsp. columellifera TaxID=706583 RepID=A0ABP6A2I1_9ACTN
MTRKRTAVTALLGAASVLGLMATTLPASATTRPAPAPAVSDDVVHAMSRDLGLTTTAVRARLAAEHQASLTGERLRTDLGDVFGGSWLDNGRLVVGVTDQARADQARAAGAEVRAVSRTLAQLDGAVARLDAAKGKAPAGVSVWYVDPTTNAVVVQAPANSMTKARSFVKAAGVAAEAVRYEVTNESPRLLADIVGGNAYMINSSGRCSVGFAVQGGFVTAGHCGKTGARVTTREGAALGSFHGSTFPGDDLAVVKVDGGHNLQGAVNNYKGGVVRVAGSTPATVGASICRSGSTTGWHCGTIRSYNATVTYPQGSVTGLIQTNVCAEPGDSGGSAISGSQAQGVTSGGSGNCSSGGTTYFQPVNEILQRYGAQLITS